VTLKAATKYTLKFKLYYANRATAFFSPATLDFKLVKNQQYRVDIMKTTAPVTSVAPGDVLAKVFQTKPGDPLILAPTAKSVSLTPFAGKTVRIRFAEVDNQLFFQASVDAVTLTTP
jgi:hypothetical protein